MIKTEQLRYLIELNRTNSFHKCAKNLHLSQPAVSLAIQNLEKELGVELFTRTSSGVYPTLIGEQVVKKAKNILENVEEIYLRANEYQMEKTKEVKKVTFYATETVLSSVLLSVILKMQKQYPSAKILSKEWDGKSLEEISKDSCGIGMQYLWKDSAEQIEKQYPELRLEPVCPLHYYLAMDENASFVIKSGINLEEVKADRESIPVVLYGRSSDITREILNLLIKNHNATLLFQAPTEKLFDTYIRQGLGAGIVVQYGTNKLLPNNKARDHFVFVPLKTDRESEFYFITNRNMEEELHQRITRYLQFGVEFL